MYWGRAILQLQWTLMRNASSTAAVVRLRGCAASAGQTSPATALAMMVWLAQTKLARSMSEGWSWLWLGTDSPDRSQRRNIGHANPSLRFRSAGPRTATGNGAVSRNGPAQGRHRVRTTAAATHFLTVRPRRHRPRTHDALLWADAAERPGQRRRMAHFPSAASDASISRRTHGVGSAGAMATLRRPHQSRAVQGSAARPR
jgi:hypothetical protein